MRTQIHTRIKVKELPGQLAMALLGLSPMIFLLVALLLLSGCGSDAAEPQGAPPPAVSVAQVLSREVNTWDEFTGRVEAVETVEIRPRVNGYIHEVRYGEGREVKKGEVLFVIDQRPYRAELARAEAELARARAQAALADSEVGRARQLLTTRAISQEEYDQRLAADSQASANVRAAEAAAEVARLNLEFTEVRSPVAGRAGRAMVTQGNLVAAGDTLLTTVVSLDPVYVYFEGDEQVYLRSADLARTGNTVFVGLSHESGFPHEGRLDFVDNQLNPETGTIRSRAVLANPDRLFTPGLFARVRLQGNSTQAALLVDDKAILTDQDRKYVYVLGPENKALRRDVKIGRVLDGMRIVTAGLTASDQVIVHGVQKVFFPGMAVEPQRVAMGDGPRAAQLSAAPSPPAPLPLAGEGGPEGRERASADGRKPT